TGWTRCISSCRRGQCCSSTTSCCTSRAPSERLILSRLRFARHRAKRKRTGVAACYLAPQALFFTITQSRGQSFVLGGAVMAARKVRVAIVGLGFGAEFIPIYQAHPDAEMYAICWRNKAELDACGDRFGIKARYTDYNELLKDPNVDAVHI